jgi:ribonuclease P protein component
LATDETGPARAGFVVSRRVGSAVVRNRVRRRLREQARGRLATLRPGTLLIIRALPAAADSTYDELGRALDRGLAQLAAGAGPRPARPRGGGRGRAPAPAPAGTGLGDPAARP